MQETWTLALTISKVLLPILSLLPDLNTDIFLNREIALMCKNDKAKYEQNAKEWNLKYAM